MTDPTPPFGAYLDAKRALDERSLHGPTWGAYIDFLTGGTAYGSARAVLELGAGTGAMLDRTLRALASGDGFASGEAFSYTAVDSSKESIDLLHSRFAETSTRGTGPRVETRCGDVFGELAALAAEGRRFDAVVSHAFADLVDIPLLASAAASVLAPGGVFYNSLVFDGVTAFIAAAVSDENADDRYIAAYHRSMRRSWNGKPAPPAGAHEGVGTANGASGRRLLAHLALPPWRILSAGPSDWVVLPRISSAMESGVGAREQGSARPTEDETVTAAMLGFFAVSVPSELAEAARSRAGSYDGGLYADDGWSAEEGRAFDAWLSDKRERLSRGELGFYAHNLDVLAVLRN